MNNEIKEIINHLQKVANRETASRNALMEMKDNDYQLLLDYITNLQREKELSDSLLLDADEHIDDLQEENERLKEIVENLTTMTVCGDRKQIKNTAQYKLDIYKSRNEKAIEKLKTLIPICIMPNNTLVHGTEKAKIIEETLNILKGDNNE